ncbi:MAG: hypothetical protein Q9227_005786 [Pyrenula ochraceoflavens]
MSEGPITRLPLEVLGNIFNDFDLEILDLRNIRLASRLFADVVTPLLYRELHIEYPNCGMPYTDNPLRKAEKIVEHSRYRALVKEVNLEFGPIYGAFRDVKFRETKSRFKRLLKCLKRVGSTTTRLDFQIEDFYGNHDPFPQSDGGWGPGEPRNVDPKPILEILRAFPNLSDLTLHRVSWPGFENFESKFLRAGLQWRSLRQLSLEEWASESDQTLIQCLMPFRHTLRHLLLVDVVIIRKDAPWRPVIDTLRNEFQLDRFIMFNMKGGSDGTDPNGKMDDSGLSGGCVWPLNKRCNIMNRINQYVLGGDEDPFALWCDKYRERDQKPPELLDDTEEFFDDPDSDDDLDSEFYDDMDMDQYEYNFLSDSN